MQSRRDLEKLVQKSHNGLKIDAQLNDFLISVPVFSTKSSANTTKKKNWTFVET